MIKRQAIRLKNIIMDNRFLLFNCMFIFFLFSLISYFIPLTGDDWTNANFNTNNIFKILTIAYDKYFSHEGRFASRIFVIFFTNTKWLWNIFNAFMMAGIYYLAMKIIKPSNIKLASILFILAMLLLENTMFTQSYLWVTGNCTYVLPMFLFLLYIFLVDRMWMNNGNNNKWTYIIMIILNTLIPTMIEHISISLVIANIFLLIINYIKFKKVSKILLLNTIISIVGFLFIYLSPGATIRASEYEFSNYSILKKVITNIPNFIKYTYLGNNVLIFLITILINVYFFYNKKINIQKICISILVSVIPTLTILSNLLYIISEKSSKARFILEYTNFSLDSNNIFIILYWIAITIILLIINFSNLKCTKNSKAIFFYIIGIGANCAMLLSPLWGGRTGLFTLTMLYINIIILLNNKVRLNLKIVTNLLYLFFFAYSGVLLILYNSVYRQNLNREYEIKEQLAKNYDIISIERFPDTVLWNSNAYNGFHEASFKKYYSIPEDKKIERIKVIYKYYLFY